MSAIAPDHVVNSIGLNDTKGDSFTVVAVLFQAIEHLAALGGTLGDQCLSLAGIGQFEGLGGLGDGGGGEGVAAGAGFIALPLGVGMGTDVDVFQFLSGGIHDLLAIHVKESIAGFQSMPNTWRFVRKSIIHSYDLECAPGDGSGRIPRIIKEFKFSIRNRQRSANPVDSSEGASMYGQIPAKQRDCEYSLFLNCTSRSRPLDRKIRAINCKQRTVRAFSIRQLMPIQVQSNGSLRKTIVGSYRNTDITQHRYRAVFGFLGRR